MEEKYVPISLGEMMPELRYGRFQGIYWSTDLFPKIDASSFLLAELGIDPDKVKSKKLFVRYYIHTTMRLPINPAGALRCHVSKRRPQKTGSVTAAADIL